MAEGNCVRSEIWKFSRCYIFGDVQDKGDLFLEWELIFTRVVFEY